MPDEIGISGIFNNCGLHVLTPELVSEIHSRAEAKGYSNSFNAAYEKLKVIFAAYYEFDNARFSWRDFSDLLSRYKNPFDLQMILGPVLREFVHWRTTQDQNLQNFYTADDIEQFYSLQDDGRYASLAPDELHTLLYGPLGFSLQYDRAGVGGKVDVANALACIKLFHSGGLDGASAGGHWERAKVQPGTTIVRYEDEAHHPQLAAIAGLSKYDIKAISEFSLKLLKKHVQGAPVGKLNLTAAVIEKYLFNLNLVRKEYARELLSTGGVTLTAEAKEFIREYKPEHSPTGITLYEQVISSNFKVLEEATPRGDGKSVGALLNFNDLQAQLILQLAAPVQTDIVRLEAKGSAEQKADSSGSDLDVACEHALRRLAHPKEVSALLEQLPALLQNETLANALYELCNKPDFVERLSPEFVLALKQQDEPKFKQSAQPQLTQRALYLEVRTIVFAKTWDTRGYSKLNLFLLMVPVIGWLVAAVWGLKRKTTTGIATLRQAMPEAPDPNNYENILQGCHNIVTQRLGVYSPLRCADAQKEYEALNAKLGESSILIKV